MYLIEYRLIYFTYLTFDLHSSLFHHSIKNTHFLQENLLNELLLLHSILVYLYFMPLNFYYRQILLHYLLYFLENFVKFCYTFSFLTYLFCLGYLNFMIFTLTLYPSFLRYHCLLISLILGEQDLSVYSELKFAMS